MNDHMGPTGDLTPDQEGWDSGEGNAELQDPQLQFEASSASLRTLWATWMCQKGGDWKRFTFYGEGCGSVPSAAHDAFVALESALKSTGFAPTTRSGTYNCRKIKDSDSYSLHSYGIAIDVDWDKNPHEAGDPYSGTIKKPQVNAVLAIKNTNGRSVFSWGGSWKTPDRMHFQLDVGPGDVTVDWATVPGGEAGASQSPSAAQAATTAASTDQDEEEQVLKKGAGGMAVTQFQKALLAWDPKSLPKYGADGDYGTETVLAVKAFQKAAGLEETGTIDGVTAALLGPKIPS